MKGPGADLFNVFRETFGSLPVIAEDLGLITPSVIQLRDEFDLPSMRVLQFAFDDGPTNDHLPHNLPVNSAIYTGTHDNDTTAGWYASLKPKEKKVVNAYLPRAKRPSDVVWELIRQAWASPSRLAVVPAQDLLGLGSEARMNTPGTDDGNWRWRLDSFDAIAPTLMRLKELGTLYNRTASL